MLVNDDLGTEQSATKVIEIREFDSFSKNIYGWFERFLLWIFRIPMNIKKKYLYDCIFKIEHNIFEKNDSLEVNGIQMHVTNTDEFSDTIWCTSLDWSIKHYEKEDFEGSYLLRSGNMHKEL